MHFSQTINAIAHVSPKHFSSLTDVLSPGLMDECLEHASVAMLAEETDRNT